MLSYFRDLRMKMKEYSMKNRGEKVDEFETIHLYLGVSTEQQHF